jgi:thymidine kinase
MGEPGRIEVICGPMFAGKTEELLRRVRRAAVAGREVRVFGHALDTRSGASRLLSHAGLDHPALLASSPADIEERVGDASGMVAIDEAQFFGPELVAVAARLARRGLTVVIAGLDVTFEGLPFEPLPSLMALAERVDKLTAICVICGEEAVFHVRRSASARGAVDLVPDHVGGQDKYEARCRRHFPAA